MRNSPRGGRRLVQSDLSEITNEQRDQSPPLKVHRVERTLQLDTEESVDGEERTKQMRRSRSPDLIAGDNVPLPMSHSPSVLRATPTRMVYLSDRAQQEILTALREKKQPLGPESFLSKIVSWSGSAVVRSLLELLALVNTSTVEVIIVVSSRLSELRIEKGVLHNSDILASLLAFAIGVSPFRGAFLETIVHSPLSSITTSHLESNA